MVRNVVLACLKKASPWILFAFNVSIEAIGQGLPSFSSCNRILQMRSSGIGIHYFISAYWLFRNFSSHPGIVAEQSNTRLQDRAKYWTNVGVRATYFEYLGIFHIQLLFTPYRKSFTYSLHIAWHCGIAALQCIAQKIFE